MAGSVRRAVAQSPAPASRAVTAIPALALGLRRARAQLPKDVAHGGDRLQMKTGWLLAKRHSDASPSTPPAVGVTKIERMCACTALLRHPLARTNEKVRLIYAATYVHQ